MDEIFMIAMPPIVMVFAGSKALLRDNVISGEDNAASTFHRAAFHLVNPR